MINEITVREWIKNFNNGEYNILSEDTQSKAGWVSNFHNIDETYIRLRKLGYIISGITNDILLNYYTLKLYNYQYNLTTRKGFALYDAIILEPIDKNMFPDNYTIKISIKKPEEECLFNVTLVSWNKYAREFSCNEINMLYMNLDMMINNLYKRPMMICNK